MKLAYPNARDSSLDALATTGPGGAGRPSLALCVLLCLVANALAALSLWLFGRPLVPVQEPVHQFLVLVHH